MRNNAVAASLLMYSQYGRKDEMSDFALYKKKAARDGRQKWLFKLPPGKGREPRERKGRSYGRNIVNHKLIIDILPSVLAEQTLRIGRRDSNPRMQESKSCALPLGDGPLPEKGGGTASWGDAAP